MFVCDILHFALLLLTFIPVYSCNLIWELHGLVKAELPLAINIVHRVAERFLMLLQICASLEKRKTKNLFHNKRLCNAVHECTKVFIVYRYRPKR